MHLRQRLEQTGLTLLCAPVQEAERLLRQLAGLLDSLQPMLAGHAILEDPRQPLALSVLSDALAGGTARLRDSQHPVILVRLQHAPELLQCRMPHTPYCSCSSMH